MAEQKTEAKQQTLTQYSQEMIEACNKLKSWNRDAYAQYQPLKTTITLSEIGAKTEQTDNISDLKAQKAQTDQEKIKLGKMIREEEYIPDINSPESLVFAILYHQSQLKFQNVTIIPHNGLNEYVVKPQVIKGFNERKKVAKSNAEFLKKDIDAYIGNRTNKDAIRDFFKGHSPEDQFADGEEVTYEILLTKINTITTRPSRDIDSIFAEGMKTALDNTLTQPATTGSVAPITEAKAEPISEIKTALEIVKTRFQQIEDAFIKIAKAKQLIEILQQDEKSNKHFSEILKNHKNLFDSITDGLHKDEWEARWHNVEPIPNLLAPLASIERKSEGPDAAATTGTTEQPKPASSSKLDWFWNLSSTKKALAVGGGIALATGGAALTAGAGAVGIIASTLGIGGIGGGTTKYFAAKTEEKNKTAELQNTRKKLIEFTKQQIDTQAAIIGFEGIAYETTPSTKFYDLANKAALLKSIFAIEHRLELYLAEHKAIKGGFLGKIQKWFATELPEFVKSKTLLELEVNKLKNDLTQIKTSLHEAGDNTPIEDTRTKIKLALDERAIAIDTIEESKYGGFFSRQGDASINALKNISHSTISEAKEAKHITEFKPIKSAEGKATRETKENKSDQGPTPRSSS